MSASDFHSASNLVNPRLRGDDMEWADHLAPIAERYDAFILDLWGVVHDGVHLYPTSAECLARLHAAGKRLVFLSNAPRRASVVEAGLARFGIPRSLYEAAYSSGEVAHRLLAEKKLAFGPRVFFIGLEQDEPVLEGLSQVRVATPDEADFALCAGYSHLFQPPEEQDATLARLAARALPMLCINPDIEVVRQDGSVIHCAGHLAARYAELGGGVTYIGKPHASVYDAVRAQLHDVPAARILAVGDSLHTDILGANRAGIASALIAGGIHRRELDAGTALETLCAHEGAAPDYVLPAFAW